MENIVRYNHLKLSTFKSVWEQKISEPQYYAILFQSHTQLASKTDISINFFQPYVY